MVPHELIMLYHYIPIGLIVVGKLSCMYIPKYVNSTMNLRTIYEQFSKIRKSSIWGPHCACLPQSLKSTFFEIFSSGGSPKATQSEENFSKNVEFSL